MFCVSERRFFGVAPLPLAPPPPTTTLVLALVRAALGVARAIDARPLVMLFALLGVDGGVVRPAPDTRRCSLP